MDSHPVSGYGVTFLRGNDGCECGNDDLMIVSVIFVPMMTWGGVTKRYRQCRHILKPLLRETWA